MRWFRFYSEALNDPKVQRLPPALFKHWVNILCLACERDDGGVLPTEEDIAFALRLKPSDAHTIMDQLATAGLVDRAPQGRAEAASGPRDARWMPHNWAERQYAGDTGRPPLSEWRVLRAAVFARDDYTCAYCGARGVSLQADHVIPVSRGGGNELTNLTTACKPCNQSKHARTPDEWLRIGASKEVAR